MAHVRKVEHRPRLTGGKPTISWQARWTGADGKPKAKNFATKGEATSFLKTAGDAGGSPTMTVSDLALAHYRYFDTLVKAGVREQGTLDGYATAMDLHLASDAAFAKTRLSDLTTPKCQAFLDALFGRAGSLDLTKRVRRSLVTWCKFGQRKGWLVGNPAQPCTVEAMTRPEQGEEKLELPSKAELAALIAAAAEGEQAARDTAVTSVLLFAGLRPSELLGLADDNVTIAKAGGTLRVRERLERKYGTLGKVKSEKGRRDIPIGPQTASAVKAWRLERGKTDRLFPGRGNATALWTYQQFSREYWIPLMKRAGLTLTEADSAGKNRTKAAFSPYALRHAYASNLIENGVRPKKLQQLMGHATLQLTMDTYGHLWRDEVEDDAIARNAERLALGSGPLSQSLAEPR